MRSSKYRKPVEGPGLAVAPLLSVSVKEPCSIGAHLVMRRYAFHPAKEFSRFGFEDGRAVIVAGETANGVQRIEKVDDDELRFLPDVLFQWVASQYVTAAIAGDSFEAGKNNAAQQALVCFCIFGLCPTAPVTCDHTVLFEARTPESSWKSGQNSGRKSIRNSRLGTIDM